MGREIPASKVLELYDGKLSRTVLMGRRAVRPLATRCKQMGTSFIAYKAEGFWAKDFHLVELAQALRSSGIPNWFPEDLAEYYVGLSEDQVWNGLHYTMVRRNANHVRTSSMVRGCYKECRAQKLVSGGI